jgi:hypothetical protein
MYTNSVRNMKRRENLEDLGVDGKILKERMFMKQDVKAWNGFFWLRDELLRINYVYLGYMKDNQFCNYLSYYNS